jgi:4-aminobutyrate aminotransferase-like enzyme
MIGIECDRPETAARACSAALSRGIILLPSGDDGRVLSITPPLCIERDALIAALEILVECIQ